MAENKLYQNIKYLCTKKEMKISEAERALNVSKGFLSRAKKDIYSSKLYNLSQYFGYSMEQLLMHDLQEENRINDIDEEIEKLKAERERLLNEKQRKV